MSEIAKWYSRKNIFLTGATGFVGKCLIEKLLRSCPDIGDIYVIIRNKGKQNFEQRKHDYTKHLIFQNLREQNMFALEKIKFVEGDLSEPMLGLNEYDRKMIAENCSIIFHSAADVHFDKRLIDAYYINYYGTKTLLNFALEFKYVDVSLIYLFT